MYVSKNLRRNEVKYLRVRGFKAVGVNIFKAAAVRKVVNNGKAAHGGVLTSLMHRMYGVKERFLNAWGELRSILTLFDRRCYRLPLMTAA